MKNYFNSLNERERWMVVVGGLCIILYFYYLFAYGPLSRLSSEKSMQLAEKINTLKWMKQVQQQAHPSKVKKSFDNSQLLTIIASDLKNNPYLKFPYQLQQISGGEIQLSFDKVPFTLFLKWLKNLTNDYAITIKQLDAEPTKTPGVTRLNLILTMVTD